MTPSNGELASGGLFFGQPQLANQLGTQNHYLKKSPLLQDRTGHIHTTTNNNIIIIGYFLLGTAAMYVVAKEKLSCGFTDHATYAT